MFQTPPPQLLLKLELRAYHCCCEPGSTQPSSCVFTIMPPLAQPPSHRKYEPLMWMRRIATACETAQCAQPVPSDGNGAVARFSIPRQKLHVALCVLPDGSDSQSARTSMLPLIVTSSGLRPRPTTCV